MCSGIGVSVCHSRLPWRRVPLHTDAPEEAPAKKAKKDSASASSSATAEWAERYLASAAPIPGGVAAADPDDALATGPPKIVLDDDALDRIFEDFVDPDRIARMEGPRVAENFMVKLRGQDANVDKKGDRYDVARAQPQGKHMEVWTAAQFLFKSWSITIKKAGGDDPARKLCQEWCRKMEFMYELHQGYGSWAASGGIDAILSYEESTEFREWIDSLPEGDYCRTKAEELRKLKPMDV